MSISIVAYKNRTCTFTVTVRDSSNEIVTFPSGDVMRIKIGRGNATPILDLDSAQSSANGTTVEAANPSDVTLDQDDADLLQPGIYDIEAAIVDASDQSRIKQADKGLITVVRTQGGDVGTS